MPDEATTQQETPAQSQESTPDLGPLNERLDSFRDEVLSRLPEPQQQQQGYQEYDPAYDPQFQQGYPPYQEGQQQYDPNAPYQQDPYAQQPYAQDPSLQGQVQQQAPQQSPQAFNEAVRSAVQQEMQPWRQQQIQGYRDQGYLDLEEQIPEIAQNKEVAEKLVGSAGEVVGEIAPRVSQFFGLPDEASQAVVNFVMTDPTILEYLYKAGQADLSAAQETPAGTETQGVQLERDAGSVPAQAEDPADEVLPRRSGGPAADYWGV